MKWEADKVDGHVHVTTDDPLVMFWWTAAWVGGNSSWTGVSVGRRRRDGVVVSSRDRLLPFDLFDHRTSVVPWCDGDGGSGGDSPRARSEIDN